MYHELEIGKAIIRAFSGITNEHKNLFCLIEEMIELITDRFLKPLHTLLPPTATIGIILSANKDGSLTMKVLALNEIKKMDLF